MVGGRLKGRHSLRPGSSTVNEIAFRLYLLAGASLVAIGFFGILASAELLRKILGVNIMGSGIFLILVGLAARTTDPIPDPVPHAMVLTGIVVSVCGTALALALADRVRAMKAREMLNEEEEE